MQLLSSPLDRECVLDGRTYLCFAGCGYLGLSNEPTIRQAVIDAYGQQGMGVGISRRYGIRCSQSMCVEEEVARFFGAETSRFLSSGFVTNQVLIHVAAGQVDYIAADDLAHYSLDDAFRQLGVPVHRFRHRDPEDLARVVRSEGGRPLVATDGAFATFGWVAPLAEYWRIIEPQGGWMLVDEAHSAGCIGSHRRGAYDLAGLSGERILITATMSKAFCASGGVVLLNREQEGLIQERSPLVRGASEPCIPAMVGVGESLRYLARHPERFARLDARATQLRAGFRELGLAVPDTLMPIVTVEPAEPDATAGLFQGLLAAGILVQHSFYIGTGPGGALRHTVMASHSEEDIARLLAVWKTLLG